MISLSSPYSPIEIVLVMWHNTVQSSVYFRRVRSKIRSGCTLEVPNEIRDSKPLSQLVGHPKATMRYEPHFLARNERHNQKEICLPNSVIMSHSRFLLFDVTILIVCVLWSRTLKKVKVQNRIESTVGKKTKRIGGRHMIHTQLYLMSVSILGEQEKNNDCSDDSLTWCVLSTQTDRQTDRQTYGSIVSHLCLSNLDETWVSEYPRATYEWQKM